VEKVTIRMTHENGQATDFHWMFLNETFSQVKTAEGVSEVGRNQPAVALKVSTLVLTEKQIGLQERGFEEDSRGLIAALIDRHDHFKKTEPDTYQQLTLKSKEFADLIAFAGKRFIWQEGRYTVLLELRVVGVKDPTIQTFHFTLTSVEITRLRQNLEEIERYVRDLILPPAEAERGPYRWNWAYPLFDQSNLSRYSERAA